MTAALPDEGLSPAAIARRASACGLELSDADGRALSRHARLVLERNAILHLTTIVEPAEFLERHLGEAFEGAALLPTPARGRFLDLGSGNGYPGIPVAIARRGLDPVLAESSVKKAAFLGDALAAAGLTRGRVVLCSVQRAADLAEEERFALITSRAVPGWERIVPKLASCLSADGRILIWAGANLESVLRRTAWKAFAVEAIRPLPGRSSAVIAMLRMR